MKYTDFLKDFMYYNIYKSKYEYIQAIDLKGDTIVTESMSHLCKIENIYVSDVEPVLLTGKILLGNGFKSTSPKYYVYEPGNLVIMMDNEGFSIGICFVKRHYKYVHELQNILRVIGYDKFANNLIIK